MQDVSVDDFLDWMAGISVTDDTRWILWAILGFCLLGLAALAWVKADLPRPSLRRKRRH